MWRKLLRRMHPQAIPWPASLLYDRLSQSEVFQHHYHLVAEDLPAGGAGSRLLDIGTGPGWLLPKIHQARPEWRLTGVDLSRAMVSKARQNLRKAGLADSISVLAASAERLPFPDGSFDLVVSTGSLHHWRNPIAGLNEAYRVLRAGGQALVYDLVLGTPAAAVAELARRFGRFKAALFRLHSFEEPFHNVASLESLAAATAFGSGRTRFVGVLCCLELHKAG